MPWTEPKKTSFPSVAVRDFPDPPSKLKTLLEKYKRNTSMSTKVKKPWNIVRSRNTKKQTMNGFTAFRSFYSRNIRAYKSQIDLSQRMAKIWNEDKKLQLLWCGYVEEYKSSNTCEAFTFWLDLKKNALSSDLQSPTISQTNEMSHFFVEDVYDDSVPEMD
ncbi:hypothetical protein FOA43_001725 [Brettanomyces nanus]|uniref:Alpha box domain-containing protein n=1 Tax=Eeniella nana TaxID=13502 RepID=A0A875RUB5_EENNA|nr:uncharacterized protein FOA43_001725 [Brettanomyces nanus]QPG74397.1 hypothetical protein FOA43_001725 [Brettanomyces nanus]